MGTMGGSVAHGGSHTRRKELASDKVINVVEQTGSTAQQDGGWMGSGRELDGREGEWVGCGRLAPSRGRIV